MTSSPCFVFMFSRVHMGLHWWLCPSSRNPLYVPNATSLWCCLWFPKLLVQDSHVQTLGLNIWDKQITLDTWLISSKIKTSLYLTSKQCVQFFICLLADVAMVCCLWKQYIQSVIACRSEVSKIWLEKLKLLDRRRSSEVYQRLQPCKPVRGLKSTVNEELLGQYSQKLKAPPYKCSTETYRNACHTGQEPGRGKITSFWGWQQRHWGNADRHDLR